jgi:hypothetical protein
MVNLKGAYKGRSSVNEQRGFHEAELSEFVIPGRGYLLDEALDFQRSHPNSVSSALIDPVQELGDGIYLVVVTSVRELHQLHAKIVEP